MPVVSNCIKLPVIGCVRFRQSRPIPDGGIIKQARVVRRISGWYVMLTVQWDVSIPDIIPHGNPVGIDVGLTNFIATYNGLLIKRHRFFIDAERKLKLLQRRNGVCRIFKSDWADVAAAQIVLQRGLAAVGYTVKMHGTRVNSLKSLPSKNPHALIAGECQNLLQST